MESIKEISFLEVSDSQNPDFRCFHCYKQYKVLIETPFINKWKTYKNPNYNIIDQGFPGLRKFLELCPEAIKFVIQLEDEVQCPNCGQTKMSICLDSKYFPRAILRSLTCHLSL